MIGYLTFFFFFFLFLFTVNMHKTRDTIRVLVDHFYTPTKSNCIYAPNLFLVFFFVFFDFF
ncbi:hypothetical protein GGR50DRAFT_668342 [Xylaria sp. CBS 124048]|nr:hypothetical protein GGR50DRAFT_668342 [Xylaria sp. CBS 124048]